MAQEQQLLRHLGFRMDVRSPYLFLLNYARTFGFSPRVVRFAWASLNDCMASDLCIRYAVHILAAGALAFAAWVLEEEPVTPVINQKKWYLICDVTEKQLQEIVVQFVKQF